MSVAIGMIPLGEGASVSRSKFAAHFESTWDDVVATPEIEKEKGVLTFKHGDYFVAIALMPAPIPDIEGPSQTSWLWANAEAELANHKGHLIVTVLQGPDEDDALERRRLLTEVVASVVATSKGALGVYWGDAGMVVEGRVFVEMAKEMLPDDNPIPLWVDFRVGPVDQESGLSYGFTAGLDALGLMEIATQNANESPSELQERMMDLTAYLLANGMIIESGHTIGQHANEKITVNFAPSPFGHDGDVMLLDYGRTKKKKSWFGRR